jgi:hypothetical protein
MEGNQLDSGNWVSLPEQAKMVIISAICRDFNSAGSFENYLWKTNLLYPYGLGHTRWELIPPTTPDDIKKSIRDVIDFSKISKVSEIVDALRAVGLHDIANRITQSPKHIVPTQQTAILCNKMESSLANNIADILSGTNNDLITQLQTYLFKKGMMKDVWNPAIWETHLKDCYPGCHPGTYRNLTKFLLQNTKDLTLTGLMDILCVLGFQDIANKVGIYNREERNIISTNRTESVNMKVMHKSSVNWKDLDERSKMEIVYALSGNFNSAILLEDYFYKNGTLNGSTWGHDNWSRYQPETQEQKQAAIRVMLNFPITLKLSDLANALNKIGRPDIAELVENYMGKNIDQEPPTKSTKIRTPDIVWYKIDMKKKLDARSVISTSDDIFLKLGEALKTKGKIGIGEWFALSRAEASTKSQAESRAWTLLEKVGSKGMMRDELINTLREISYSKEADLIEEILQ